MQIQFRNPKVVIFAAIALLAFIVVGLVGGERTGPYLAVVFFGVTGAVWAYAVYVRLKMRAKGIETNAVVTSIETGESTDEDGFSRTDFYYHVRYQNQSGETVDGVLQFFVSGRKKLQVGDRVKIKYLPNRQEQPIMTEKL